MLCNVVDVTHLCNFILPSIVRHGDLAIAVSTGGASPAMARRIRIALAQCYGDEYAVALELLGSLREELKATLPEPRGPQDRCSSAWSTPTSWSWCGPAMSSGIEAWIQTCIDEGPGYATPAQHRAMVEAAQPECKLRFAPLVIENAANGSTS